VQHVAVLADLSFTALVKEAARNETSVNCKTTRHDIWEGCHLYTRRHEVLKSHPIAGVNQFEI
jgi:hypothetical protein